MLVFSLMTCCFYVKLRAAKTDFRAVSGIQFSPDGRHIATAFKYGHLAVWDARDLRKVASINLDWFEVTGMDYSKDGTRCAVVLTKGIVIFTPFS